MNLSFCSLLLTQLEWVARLPFKATSRTASPIITVASLLEPIYCVSYKWQSPHDPFLEHVFISLDIRAHPSTQVAPPR
ncbi:hypothetical protein EV363DRAFT_385185 [Boletus edulis]|nr:hypothetical protein EV363DRAFT_385185 [Boletus edulis]